METVLYGGREIPVAGVYDTVVIGGGTSGIFAAVRSSEKGLKTLVLEKHTSPGGTPVHGLVTPMMPSYTKHFPVFYSLEEGLGKRGRFTREDGLSTLYFCGEDLAETEEEFLCSAGGEIFYDTCFVDCMTDGGGKISCAVARTSEGLLAVRGKFFIDASGDAVLARAAGIPADSGDDEGDNQISSYRFEMGGINIEKFKTYCQSIGDNFYPVKDGRFFETAMVEGKGFALEALFKKGVESGILEKTDLRYFQCFTIPGKAGCMSFNCPHIPEMTKNTNVRSRSQGIISGRKRIRRLVRFLQEYMPGFEEAFLLKEANMLGVRESYRIRGKYILTEKDYLARRKFPDGVIRGDWYIDVHSKEGEEVKRKEYRRGEYYEIPYRCFINDRIRNLITVGRCISTTFLMQASVRIQPTVIDMGYMAGEACAYAMENGVELAEIDGAELKKRWQDNGRKQEQ